MRRALTHPDRPGNADEPVEGRTGPGKDEAPPGEVGGQALDDDESGEDDDPFNETAF